MNKEELEAKMLEELEAKMLDAFYRCTDTSTEEEGCLLSYSAYKEACTEVLIHVLKYAKNKKP